MRFMVGQIFNPGSLMNLNLLTFLTPRLKSRGYYYLTPPEFLCQNQLIDFQFI